MKKPTNLLLIIALIGGLSFGSLASNIKDIQEVTEKTFEGVVLQSNHVPVVIYIYAMWCGPCKAFDPIVAELSGNYAGKILFAKGDIDNNINLLKEKIVAVPTLLLFSNGNLVDSIIGCFPKDELEKKILLVFERNPITKGKK